MYEKLDDITCQCPMCGKIYIIKKYRVFNHDKTKLFKKYCEHCRKSAANTDKNIDVSTDSTINADALRKYRLNHYSS